MARGLGSLKPRGKAEQSLHDETLLGRADDIRMLRRFWVFVRPYRGLFALSALLLPCISALLIVQPWLLKVAVDEHVTKGDITGLPRIAFFFTAAVFGEFVCLYLQYWLTMLVSQRVLADLRVALFRHLERLPQSWFDRNPTGRVVTRLTTDVDVLSEAFASGAMTIFMDAITLTGILSVMLWIDWRLALVSFVAVPGMVVVIDLFRRRARLTYRLIRERIAAINGFLQESISGMGVIQLFAHEGQSQLEFRGFNAANRDANQRSNIYEAALFAVVEAVTSISMAFVLWYGTGRLLDGAVAFGTLVAFFEYVQKFFIPVRDFSSKYAVLQSAATAAERVFELLDTPVAIESSARALVPLPGVAARGAVSFEDVWFAYRKEHWVVESISLKLEPGEMVAIVGATGSGKTTLTRLLGRAFDVSRGRILVSGIDVRDWDLAALRREIGIVLQDVHCFSGSVADNISLWRPGISSEDLDRAIDAACLRDLVSRLPHGLEERVRERGNNLSAGERQLLAIARALAYDPKILVLDEATSSIDPETERLIQQALERATAGRTSIVIAHRLSTVERADRIVVMHHGRIREMGTHQELLARGEIYARLYALG